MFFRCSKCNELRTPNYPYCPGCLSGGQVRHKTTSKTKSQTFPGIGRTSFVSKKPRIFTPYNLFASAIIAALCWTGHHSSLVKNDLSVAYAGPSLNQDMIRLCDMDQKAEDSHSYSMNMVYMKAWIGEIAGGTVRMKSLAPENRQISVTVPSKITAHQAKSRAIFYRIIYADLRKQYLPQNKANSCSVVIYNESGQKLASSEQT